MSWLWDLALFATGVALGWVVCAMFCAGAREDLERLLHYKDQQLQDALGFLGLATPTRRGRHES